MLVRVLMFLGIVSVGAGLFLRSRDRGEPEVDTSLESYRMAAALQRGQGEDWSWFRAEDLWTSVEGLRDRFPDLTVDRTVTPAQRQFLLAVGVAILACLALSWNLTLVVLVGLIIFLYFASLAVRLFLFGKALNDKGMLRISDEIARAVPDDQLPSYTVLVPAYGEPEVVGHLVENLRALEYPRDRLEVLLLLEIDDHETRAAAEAIVAGQGDIRIILIPQGGPRTKPKALNFGLLQSTGSIVTIYDAEDRPEPLQLRKAAIALAAAPHQVACVQAKLDFFNPAQNLITKWFTLDYRMWFNELLPGLVQIGAPIPLGGTSNHFRREVLVEVGAWDSFNVTEDADLGTRLHRQGYRTGIIDSTTYEEANSDFINWIKQRSRWYKGYTQTMLVHLRHPRQLYRELGPRGFALFCLFVGGTPLIAAFNPVSWGLTIVWFVWHPRVVLEVIPTLTYFVGQICWVIGNLFVLYAWLLTTRNPKERLWIAAILAPLYWIMMSLAAVKGVIQLVTAPSYWEKTQHGLDTPQPAIEKVAA